MDRPPAAAQPSRADRAATPRNPFRNERDAFRLLVIVGVSVIAVALVASQVNVVLGAVAGAVLLALALRASLRWIRDAVAARERGEEGPFGSREGR
jgi:hypothetical protein